MGKPKLFLQITTCVYQISRTEPEILRKPFQIWHSLIIYHNVHIQFFLDDSNQNSEHSHIAFNGLVFTLTDLFSHFARCFSWIYVTERTFAPFFLSFLESEFPFCGTMVSTVK